MGAGGRPKTVSDEELLAAIRESDGPATTAREITEKVELSHRCVQRRLDTLAEEGRVKTRKTSDRTRIWWLP
jgi:predicted ArsR family transcriptional regulator